MRMCCERRSKPFNANLGFESHQTTRAPFLLEGRVARVPRLQQRAIYRQSLTSTNRPAIAARLDRGHLDATTFMEYLIRRGVPQRTAHEMVGQLVRKALDRDVRLSDLPLDDFRTAMPELDESVYEVLGVDRAIAAMQSYGSTAPEQVKKQMEIWKKRVEE